MKPLWQPPVTSRLHEFCQNYGLPLDYPSLWQWSVDHMPDFWSAIWDFCGVIGDKGDRIFQDAPAIMDAIFFPNAQLNMAENLLRRRDNAEAIIFYSEKGNRESITFSSLYHQVSQAQQALSAAGVHQGDVVAAIMPNRPETIVLMLAAASLGAIFSAVSPDFGVQGILDRLQQIAPKVVLVTDGYFYNGKSISCGKKMAAVLAELPSIQQTLCVNYIGEKTPYLSWGDWLNRFTPSSIVFERFSFHQPLYVLFSSGTTGVPKCIVHRAGGVLLQHLKEHRLHSNIRPHDRVFYFTTCSWMMWHWLVSSLASEATIILFDGSPFYPSATALFDIAEQEKVTFFGTSAKYLDTLHKQKIDMTKTHPLPSLRTIASTGSPLAAETFEYVYQHLKPTVHLASIAGGTDIVSCFVLGNTLSPVYAGEIQGAGLGMAVAVFDEMGKPTLGKGEMVCAKPFPCMPIGFWNDATHQKYRDAYFNHFPNCWHHGDWIAKTDNGGFIIYGRSDATLNPNGVRIGTAEIYRQLQHLPVIKDAVVVGQEWENDVRVVLFVVLAEGEILTETLQQEIKNTIRNGASARHVPSIIKQVSDVPRTHNGKLAELAVRETLHGRAVKNKESLQNSSCLGEFAQL
jgi:acetoacetyl-CoA synthetase